MGQWLRQVVDTRDQNRIVYKSQFLTWTILLGFITKLGSRRQMRFQLDSEHTLANLNRLAHTDQETLAHSDTLNHFLGHVPPHSLTRLRREMIQRLIRMKALDHGRLFGRFLLVLDGTGQLHFTQRHCEHCLTQQRSDGSTSYYHNILEAKLITPEGLALSLDSEFIENADPGASKQDCEMKAFGRMAVRLKKSFPQLALCLLLDGLYANGTTMSICEANGWKYIITFKEGSLPALWADYQGLLKLCPENRKTITRDGVKQTLAWVSPLEHVDDRKRSHRVNAFQCREQSGSETHFFAWLSNCPITADNVWTLANRGGRCRWKIENEGFNLQKNSGFNLEHAYSTADRQIKDFYILLQIAHVILQLLERGNLLSGEVKKLFGSLKNLAHRLLESIRNVRIPAEAVDVALAARIQIRLNSG